MKTTSGDARWEQLVRRDPRADGGFWYGVKTTGVFCRPSCPSRRPKRENVVFFPSPREAMNSGFRPCRRCRPDSESHTEPHLETIVRACRRIDAAEEPIPLAALAASAGLSPYYFHRVFRKIVGVTPKGYADQRRAGKLKDGLRRGMSVTRAMYDAGFGSGSRLYGGAGVMLGMPPSRYGTGAAGIPIRYGLARTSLGRVLVAATGRGICAIDIGESGKELVERLRARFPRAELRRGDREFAERVARVVALIEFPRWDLDLPLDIRGTAFQRRVWEALRAIPPGRTASYAEVARRIGKAGAARAVARACASNVLAVAIPCHRVVRGDGTTGGYRWGADRKRALLDREAKGIARRDVRRMESIPSRKQ
jgi:AraC family transcriptional regulator of adaptative response/methylated-DNA-[protein]-cysteine methyltransferase